MRLAELGREKPDMAGVAQLKYEDCREPYRDGDILHLPEHAVCEMFPLKTDWEQFLFHKNSRLWFGGTDERPFLVELNSRSLATFLNSGISAFYHELIPRNLLRLAELIPAHQCKIRRQGDIFYLSVSFSPFRIADAIEMYTGDKPTFKNAVEYPVFSTRHIFNGEGFNDIRLFGEEVSLMVRGQITAPDHETVILERMSILGQTSMLIDPRKAD